MNINTEMYIPNDSDVKLLSHIVDSMNLRSIERESLTQGRKYIIPENIFFKILVYGYMNKKYSSREIATACKRDINFMWLLDGYKAPSHNTIARFRKSVKGLNEVFAQLITRLYELKEINFDQVFIDGTKLEANANKYSFVWKKAVDKNQIKLQDKIAIFFNELLVEYCICLNTIEEALTFMEEKIQHTELVSGKGRHKTKEQKYYEKAKQYAQRMHLYNKYNNLFDGRNSFSKTDTDATFMRMKEDYMKNGQLKPGYNLQIAVNSEYITNCMASSDRDDVKTLIPFLNKMGSELSNRYQDICADSGYESEENYDYLQTHKQTSYIKPSNYEISKTAKYIKDKSKRENMAYNAEKDYYICQNNKKLVFKYLSYNKTSSGYKQELSNYECEDCSNCQYKSKCTKSQGNRKLKYSKKFNELRNLSLKNIISDKGILLRVNRSIQVEGAFGVLKQNYWFRRFLMKGMVNIKTEFILLCFAYNIKKLHSKTQNDRNCTYLHNLN